jgi:glycerol-3-phosphate acyltransferase PlsX
MSTITIAVDAMSGDNGVVSTVDAIAIFLKSFDSNKVPTVLIVGIADEINAALSSASLQTSEKLQVIAATEIVTMDESPATALRGKKDSSMRVAINLVKEGAADVAVSAGNTGALMATAKFVLKTIPGIARPALCTKLPTLNAEGQAGTVHVLDLGANIDSSAEQLAQFGMMGSVLCTVLDDIAEPSVTLLNIGQEDLKGNEQVKQAAELLAQTHLNYQGFVEGDEISKGVTDVVVCDGFVGNAVLKTMEGTAKFISQNLKIQFNSSFLSKIAGLIARPIMYKVTEKIDPRNYNGAPLLGLNGLVFKSHGSADAKSFANALQVANIAAKNQLVSKISARIEQSVLKQEILQNND